MYCYVLDQINKDWIESNDLFPSDIALLIDNEHKKIYLFFGPQSRKPDQELGASLAEKLRKKYKIYAFQTVSDVVPIQLQVQIELLMGENINQSRNKQPRSIFMTIFMIFSLGIMLATLSILICQLVLFSGDKSNNMIIMTITKFDRIFMATNIIWWIIFGFSIAEFLAAILTKNSFLVICGLASIGLVIGLRIYLLNEILLLDVIPQDPYEIRRMNLILHIIWVVIGNLALFTVTGFPLYRLLKETEIPDKEKIDYEEIQRKSRPTILQDTEPIKMEKVE